MFVLEKSVMEIGSEVEGGKEQKEEHVSNSVYLKNCPASMAGPI